MTLFENLWNFIIRTKKIIIKYSYVFYPMLGLLFYYIFLLDYISCTKHSISVEIASIAGTLAGFMFTFLGIILALPSIDFTTTLKKYGYINYIYRTLVLGIVTLILSMLFSLFRVSQD